MRREPQPTGSSAARTAAGRQLAAVTAATSRRPIFARLRFVDRQRAAVVVLLVKLCDRGAGGIFVIHLDESKALAAARVAILNHLGTAHRTERCEECLEALIGRLVAQIADIKFLSPLRSSSRIQFNQNPGRDRTWAKMACCQRGESRGGC